jgi:hypothetical protein
MAPPRSVIIFQAARCVHYWRPWCRIVDRHSDPSASRVISHRSGPRHALSPDPQIGPPSKTLRQQFRLSPSRGQAGLLSKSAGWPSGNNLDPKKGVLSRRALLRRRHNLAPRLCGKLIAGTSCRGLVRTKRCVHLKRSICRHLAGLSASHRVLANPTS